MAHSLEFPLQNFENYCNELQRVGIEYGYVLYTNHHASNGRPATRLVPADQFDAVQNYLTSSSDETFTILVKMGVLFDTEWDRNTRHWVIISFDGWEKLHHAFERLLNKADEKLLTMTGLSSLELSNIVNNDY
jgi:hypothetical protein